MHQIKIRRLADFPGFNLFVEEKDINLGIVLLIFPENLNIFLSELDRYIPSNDCRRIFNWAQNPSHMLALEGHSDMDSISGPFLEVQSRQMRKDKFEEATSTQFWVNVQSMEPSLSDSCKWVGAALLSFRTTYLCESGSSNLTIKKRIISIDFNRKMISDVQG